MKVIDLKNMIAKGEIPKKISFEGIEYIWSDRKKDYDSFNTSCLKTGILGYLGDTTWQLNRDIEIVDISLKEEVEDIIEELENKKIITHRWLKNRLHNLKIAVENIEKGEE